MQLLTAPYTYRVLLRDETGRGREKKYAVTGRPRCSVCFGGESALSLRDNDTCKRRLVFVWSATAVQERPRSFGAKFVYQQAFARSSREACFVANLLLVYLSCLTAALPTSEMTDALLPCLLSLILLYPQSHPVFAIGTGNSRRGRLDHFLFFSLSIAESNECCCLRLFPRSPVRTFAACSVLLPGAMFGERCWSVLQSEE